MPALGLQEFLKAATELEAEARKSKLQRTRSTHMAHMAHALGIRISLGSSMESLEAKLLHLQTPTMHADLNSQQYLPAPLMGRKRHALGAPGEEGTAAASARLCAVVCAAVCPEPRQVYQESGDPLLLALFQGDAEGALQLLRAQDSR